MFPLPRYQYVASLDLLAVAAICIGTKLKLLRGTEGSASDQCDSPLKAWSGFLCR